MKTTTSFHVFLSLVLLLPLSAFAYGAIAVGDADPKAKDAATEQHFVVSGQPTREAANDAALSQCHAKGLHFCSIAVWYDACAAYARSGTNSGSAWAATEEDAKRMALASCGYSCKVIAAQCEAGK
jgi:hypothetical protein